MRPTSSEEDVRATEEADRKVVDRWCRLRRACVSLAQVALAWLLSKASVTAPLLAQPSRIILRRCSSAFFAFDS